MNSPVLLMAFNRPTLVKKVFEQIQQAKPPRLYVVADGPRLDKPNDEALCSEVRKIVCEVNWSCELKLLFREKNLGSKVSTSGAIEWFFSQEEEGIVLEDDTVPLPSFFSYCDELLERYRNTPKVMMIGGCNLISNHFHPPTGYFFSQRTICWGWASWRRAWNLYDIDMKAWPGWRNRRELLRVGYGNYYFEKYWLHYLDAIYHKKINTAWDYQWGFAIWYHQGLCVLPTHNQVLNIGFIEGTHIASPQVPSYVRRSMPRLLSFPLIHPTEIHYSVTADKLIDKYAYRIGITIPKLLRIGSQKIIDFFKQPK